MLNNTYYRRDNIHNKTTQGNDKEELDPSLMFLNNLKYSQVIALDYSENI